MKNLKIMFEGAKKYLSQLAMTTIDTNEKVNIILAIIIIYIVAKIIIRIAKK